MIMKWLRLTTKECDMLNTICGEWVIKEERHPGDIYETMRGDKVTQEEFRKLWEKVQIAYFDKDSAG